MVDQVNLVELGFSHLIDIDNIDQSRENVIIDAGMCHDIVDVTKFSKYKLIGIEASTKNYNILSEKIKMRDDRDSIKLINAALVGENSALTATIREFNHVDLSQRDNIHNLYTYSGPSTTYQIPTIKINELLKDFEAVDYLKMDVELCEIDIFMTMLPSNLNKIRQVSFEFHGNREEKNKLIDLLKTSFNNVYISDEPCRSKAHGEIFAEKVSI